MTPLHSGYTKSPFLSLTAAPAASLIKVGLVEDDLFQLQWERS